MRATYVNREDRLVGHANILAPPAMKRARGGKDEKAFFTPVLGHDRNCVNFPLLEAVLAGLWQQQRRDLWAIRAALISLGIARVASRVDHRDRPQLVEPAARRASSYAPSSLACSGGRTRTPDARRSGRRHL